MASNPSNVNAVVVVGGGFAGLTTALALSCCQPRPPIVLVEPHSRFVFLPLLYELLSAELQAWEVAPPYHSLLCERGIAHLQDRVESIDTKAKTLITSSGITLGYSQLVLSTGSVPTDFNIQGVLEHALMFRDLNDVQVLRQRIKELQLSRDPQQALVIVGAGPTGVELACKLADLLNGAAELHLIELGERVLPNAKAFNQEEAEKALNKRGIHIHLCTKVLAISANQVEFESKQKTHSLISPITHRGLIWTAGTRAVLPEFGPDFVLTGARLPINSCLEVIGLNHVLGIGDVAFNDDHCWPSTAQVALQQGEAAAQNVMALRAGKAPNPFEFKDLGEMLSLGIGEASITGMGFTLAGSLAFQMRRVAYLTKLPGLSLGLRSASTWLLGH
ncbi:MAG: NAD(P)/FAD-dependent oxidoreductase [Prochlorococcus sp.]|tara:strand:+ start:358 stop:1527 length:1170 start_codon:yes stop_codon:yes gene_type:complete